MRDDLKYNHEHYRDPTVEEAFKRIDAHDHPGYRPLIYICSPFAGDIDGNVQRARAYCRFAIKQHVIPIAPHLLYPQCLDDTNAAERELGLFMGCVLLTKCKEVWVFGDTISAGMVVEIKRARWRGMTIRYFTIDCEEAPPC